MAGFNVLLLTTVGRRSGQARTSPVGWFPAPDGSRLIVASANGAADNPAWYYNLAARPDAQVALGDHVEEVTAVQLHGDERTRAWELILAAAPRFGRYQAKTDREMPIIRLTPRTGGEREPA